MLLKHIIRLAMCIKNTLARLFLAICVLSIAACTTPTTTDTKAELLINGNDLNGLMAQAVIAEKQGSPKKENELLIIAERLFTIDAFTEAEDVIRRINPTTLDDEQLARYAISATDIYLRNQSLTSAILLLADSRISNAIEQQASIEQQQQFYRNSATLYRAAGNIAASAEQYIILGTLFLAAEATQSNNDTLWEYLSTIGNLQLEQVAVSAENSVLTGWIDLVKNNYKSQNNITAQSQAINNWQARHQQHPASVQLPTSLRLLQELVANRPKHIALLLPSEGKLAKAGESIRDGFFAAYYNNQDDIADAPTIKLYNTSVGEIRDTYQRAVSNGADIIIGPLSKDNVLTLSQAPLLSTPVLALNYIDKEHISLTQQNDTPIENSEAIPVTIPDQIDSENKRMLYQFGLSLEDEAIQVADKAWEEGHKRALIISSPADWSSRATHAFTQHWQTLGGIISGSTTLDKSESYADNIQQALHIDQSKQRASALKRLFGRNFEFEARRRHDIDMIFLVTRAREGTQIKPTLNFYYASDVPVYATSQLYTSTNSKSKNIDLDKIKLTIMPWLIRDDIPEKNTLRESKKATPDYEKLYALGVDSFLLYSRLPQLSKFPSQRLYGVTGELSVKNYNRIYRQQRWAQIIAGELQELKPAVLYDQ
ncbi:MAG: outer membrane PBP1 activator LpoA protein [Candidatus Endobugula sp.]|jgi:outer membrane PBP1 activator LpoA protein